MVGFDQLAFHRKGRVFCQADKLGTVELSREFGVDVDALDVLTIGHHRLFCEKRSIVLTL